MLGARHPLYYEPLPELDLFGNRIMTLVWERPVTYLGRVVRRPLGGPVDISIMLEAIVRQRKQRGYVRFR